MANPELSDLISWLQGSDDACEVPDLASAEDHLPICAEFADDTWNEQFMSELGPADKVMYVDNDCDEATDDDKDEATPTEVPRLKSLSEAFACPDVCDFLESKGYTRESQQLKHSLG